MRNIQEVLKFNLGQLKGKESGASLARRAGMPYRTYVSIEGGERWPRLENLEAIAAALGVPVSRLFRDPTEKASPKEALAVIAALIESAEVRKP